jgi:hypothetical protein
MARTVHQVRTSCRACGDSRLTRVLSLGPQPLANANLRSLEEAATEARYPLDLHVCETCALVQLVDVIDPEVLFRHYLYVTGTSDTMQRHNTAYAATVCDLLGLTASDLVVEVASNDGSLLRCFQAHGVRTLGVEPADNIADIARGHGVETVGEFFNSACGARLRTTVGAAKAVIGNNVLAHVDDTQDFLRGAKALIGRDGLVITEVPYARTMLEHLEYDTIYHEHLCYFSVSSLERLCRSVGLTLLRIDEVPVHGGSIRMYAGHAEEHPETGPSVRAMMEAEREIGLASVARWQQWARDVEAHRETLRAMLLDLHARGHRLAAYGAPAKGNTLLNYCGIGTDLVPFTVDRSPLKVGTFTPGMHLPVRPVQALVDDRPEYLLILAWNFAEEIMRQQRAFQDAGGRFIIPIPSPVII